MTVRLHTGDPCLYGAIREQMDVLDEKGIAYDYCPGVSSFCGAASALNLEYTLPDVSQSVIITRMAGRTPVPEKEEIASLAAHHATMVVFLSTGMLETAVRAPDRRRLYSRTHRRPLYTRLPGRMKRAFVLYSGNPGRDSQRRTTSQKPP